ncbi:MAG: DUF4085 family protein [Lysinibacillus sp.]
MTLEKKKQFERVSLLPIQESDEEWDIVIREAQEEGRDLAKELRQELEEIREELIAVIPERFHPYVQDDTLNTPTLPKQVRDDYVGWMKEQHRLFENTLEKAGESREEALPLLSEHAQEVFQDSLHDGVVTNVERIGNDLAVMLDMKGGFTSKAIILLKFVNVSSEEGFLESGSYYIYDELRRTDKGVALRVIFDCPEMQWTVECETIEAAYYFRPATYFERDEEMGLHEYVESLNSAYRHVFINDAIVPWNLETPQRKDDGFYVGGIKVAETTEECIEHIYCETYEDPYAIFSIPLPQEELEEAALGDNLEMQVRAFNTLYAEPETNKEIINRIFRNITVHEGNEMIVSVMVSHFEELGLLDEDIVNRFRDAFE